MTALSRPPVTYSAHEFDDRGVSALFFEGVPWKGRATRVFAFLGLPKLKVGERAPGLVLVHGGGGTAYIDWVRLWTSRGYAAIAVDVSGNLPDRQTGKPVRDEQGGPAGYGGYYQTDLPVEDQWAYHGVASVILANSLLRAQPNVDPTRIAVTGISWGGYLTCIAAGVDERFRLAVPVYGCGYLTENSFVSSSLAKLDIKQAERWRLLWDPSRYLSDAKMPFLWVNGTNDLFPLDSLQKSYRLTPGADKLCIRVRMSHGHGGPGENPEEIRAFVDTFLKDSIPLAEIIDQKLAGNCASVNCKSEFPLVKAELNFTKDSGGWKDRRWETESATLVGPNRAQANLPEGTTAYYFNLIDYRNLVVSSEHVDLSQPALADRQSHEVDQRPSKSAE